MGPVSLTSAEQSCTPLAPSPKWTLRPNGRMAEISTTLFSIEVIVKEHGSPGQAGNDGGGRARRAPSMKTRPRQGRHEQGDCKADHPFQQDQFGLNLENCAVDLGETVVIISKGFGG